MNHDCQRNNNFLHTYDFLSDNFTLNLKIYILLRVLQLSPGGYSPETFSSETRSPPTFSPPDPFTTDPFSPPDPFTTATLSSEDFSPPILFRQRTFLPPTPIHHRYKYTMNFIILYYFITVLYCYITAHVHFL